MFVAELMLSLTFGIYNRGSLIRPPMSTVLLTCDKKVFKGIHA